MDNYANLSRSEDGGESNQLTVGSMFVSVDVVMAMAQAGAVHGWGGEGQEGVERGRPGQ